MAGQIGDTTVPAETRKAALDGIRALYSKYSNGGTNSAGASGGWSASVVE